MSGRFPLHWQERDRVMGKKSHNFAHNNIIQNSKSKGKNKSNCLKVENYAKN